MRSLLRVAGILGLLMLTACSVNPQYKVKHAQRYGLEVVDKQLFVDRKMKLSQRRALLRKRAMAQGRVRAHFGDIQSNPRIVACGTEACYRRFGGFYSRGFAWRDELLILSPRGFSDIVISHELAHTELDVRLGAKRRRALPRWFDEGLACVVSADPRFTQRSWEQAIQKFEHRPQLRDLREPRQWLRWTLRHKDDPQLTYGTAMVAVRSWYQSVGRSGFHAALKRLAAGEPFDAVVKSGLPQQAQHQF